MSGLSTREAFKHLIRRRGVHRELEVSDSAVRSWRRNISEHPEYPMSWGVSLDRMEQLLQKAGYKKLQDTLWG